MSGARSSIRDFLMAPPSKPPLLLGISGSLRRGSYNTAILTALAEMVADVACVELFPLNDVPSYDQDSDTQSPPAAIVALRAAVRAADGLIIASPEYNAGMSGVLKNALDWISRPYGKSHLTGKAVLTITSSPASTGGARAQAQLNETLTAIAAQIVLRPQAVIGAVHSKMTADRFTDAKSLQFLKDGVTDLLRDIARYGSAVRQES
jgi:chromate reductase, NAD(P)H dehydrogenase (quinone)